MICGRRPSDLTCAEPHNLHANGRTADAVGTPLVIGRESKRPTCNPGEWSLPVCVCVADESRCPCWCRPGLRGSAISPQGAHCREPFRIQGRGARPDEHDQHRRARWGNRSGRVDFGLRQGSLLMGTDRGGHAWPRAPVREALVTLGVTLVPVNPHASRCQSCVGDGPV
jgi:hypothetical protein